MIYQGSKRVPVKEIVLHCADINTGQFDGMPPLQVFATIHRWHVERGFTRGFGYHGLIMPDGQYYRGRPFDMVGAHVLGHNTGKIGLLLIESKKISRIGRFDDWFTAAQDDTLRAMLADLRARHGIEKVTGHNDYAKRLCPGFRVAEWMSHENRR